jgi:Family of unknown function (DUF6294)
MRLIICGVAAGLVLAAASGAVGQTDPSGLLGSNMLEKWNIHWVGPVTLALQKTATEEYYAYQTRDLVLPFGPIKAGDCRMTGAHLIIRRDGTGEFRATTLTEASGADSTWHTDITLQDTKGRALFDTGDFTGPKMNDGKAATPYVWVNKFTMDRSTLRKVYDDIDHASLSYLC